jgi:tetratricopeptide (TPR) repeat protein
VEWSRKQAAPYLQMPPEKLNSTGRNTVRTLAVSLHELGQIQREMSSGACVTSYEESLGLFERIKKQSDAGANAFNLGHAYKDIPGIRNLEKAEQWYRRSLELHDERDNLGRSKCLSQMGIVTFEQFKEARASSKSEKELLKHINTALKYINMALEITPSNAVDRFAVDHNMLGLIYENAGAIEQAVSHYNQSIRYQEMQGNYYGAALTLENIAIALAQAGRHQDAIDYEKAALKNFEHYGERAADRIEKAKGLIELIEKLSAL